MIFGIKEKSVILTHTVILKTGFVVQVNLCMYFFFCALLGPCSRILICTFYALDVHFNISDLIM